MPHVSSCLSSGLQARNETGFSCPVKLYFTDKVPSSPISQIIAVESFDAEAKYFPLFENCKNQTSSVCDCNICTVVVGIWSCPHR
eukprot:Gb_04413 [translate_table: standard]